MADAAEAQRTVGFERLGEVDGGLRPTVRRGAVRATERRSKTSDYAALLSEVRDAGLLRKRPGYYAVVALANTALAAAAVVALLRLGPSPWQLLVAAAFGVVFAQSGFLAHEAALRQIFASGPANDRFARVVGPVVVGLGYTWWQQGHNRHHANPNVIGRDPSVETGAFVFQDEDVPKRSAAARRIIPVQGWLLPPALLLQGVVLHIQSLGPLLQRRAPAGERVELLVLVLRLSLFPLLVFAVLPPGLATGFLAVQLGVFGLYLGGSFVPNHVGMPLLGDARDLDYLRKQVLTARNITGGALASTITGGLSLQIEHHLFPGMARPNLRKARPIVLRHCAELGIPYLETSYARAALDVIHHMNRVGLGAGSRFSCPLVDECGRS